MSWLLLDADHRAPGVKRGPSVDAQRDRPVGGGILCAACSARVTDATQRIEVFGQHRHTFFNPAGLVYQVACFASASGCRGVGGFSAEFSWFPGRRWQVGVCAACGEHLGWHFDGESVFTALIEERIREAEH